MLRRPLAHQEIKRSRREQRLLGGTVAILSAEVPDVDPAFRLAKRDIPEPNLTTPRRLARLAKFVVFQPAPQRGLPMSRIAHQHHLCLIQRHAAGSDASKKGDDRLSALANDLKGRISERVSIEREDFKLAKTADGLGQGRELVAVEPEGLQPGEAADGFGQGRELVVP
jgi:hypothetical protein